MSWTRFLSAAKSTAIFLIVMILALEIFSFLLSKANLLIVNETPRLYKTITESGSNVGKNWWTEQDIWGAWHQKSSVAHDNKICFSVEYRSNSIGARDSEFSRIKINKSFVLLGDSFAEGYGVNFEDTAHRLIEKNTSYELLNFGTAGDFGPLQYWLIYENIAKNYSHDGVVIFLLPHNDFRDNDYEYWVETKLNLINNNGVERYRPYYKRLDKNNYSYFIPKNAVKRGVWGFEGAQASPLQLFLINNFWSANILRTLKVIILGASSKDTRPYSGYFDSTKEQQEAVIFFLEKIISLASSKKILIVSIPTYEDFNRINQGEVLENAYWRNSLNQLSRRYNERVKFLDLIEFKPWNIKDLFFTCDGHWSPYGNKWAAEIISPYLK